MSVRDNVAFLPMATQRSGRWTLTGAALLTMKSVVLLLCAYIALSGHFPPLFGQRMRAQTIEAIPVITTEDALQDDHIKTINDGVKSQNEQIRMQFLRLNALEQSVAGIQGEERGIGALLGLLSAVQIILQVKKKAA